MLRNIKEKMKSRVPSSECRNTQEVNELIENCLSSKAEFETNVSTYLSNSRQPELKEVKVEEEYLVVNFKR